MQELPGLLELVLITKSALYPPDIWSEAIHLIQAAQFFPDQFRFGKLEWAFLQGKEDGKVISLLLGEWIFYGYIEGCEVGLLFLCRGWAVLQLQEWPDQTRYGAKGG